MNHRRGNLCSRLLLESLSYLSSGVVNPRVFASAQSRAPFVDPAASKKPRRVIGNNLAKYSKVVGPGSRPQCPVAQDSEAAADGAGSPVGAPSLAPVSSSAPSYADQHLALALAALSGGDATKADSRFHSAVQLISKKSKLQRSRQKQQEHEAEAQDDSRDETRAADARASPSLDRGHVLSKHASFPQGDELSAASPASPASSSLFASPRWSSMAAERDSSGSVAAQRERRQMWLKAGLLAVIAAILWVAWFARKQKQERDRAAKQRAEDDGATNNHASSKHTQPPPNNRASGAVPQQRTTVL